MTSETHLLWTEFSDRLRAFIARRVADEADVDDILQEVYLRIHQRADSVQQPERLVSWLYQVTRNAIIDHYRRPVRRREAPTAFVPEPSTHHPSETFFLDEAGAGAAQAQQELASCLPPMIGQLPSHYREAIRLVDLRGATQREAAERLGVSVPGMKSRVQRGRRALKDMLQDCCRIEQDVGGRITGYEPPGGSCTGCGGPTEETA